MGRERWAIRAVPIATFDSRGCWRKQVRVTEGMVRRCEHQQADEGRRQCAQSGRGRDDIWGTQSRGKPAPVHGNDHGVAEVNGSARARRA